MTVAKGKAWGWSSPLPDEGVVVADDAAARRALEEARWAGRPWPVLGLVGGDLCRTLGGGGDVGRLTSCEAMTFPVDLGEALIDGRLHLFVAHLLAHDRLWTRVTAAMNAQWRGGWNLGPRAHPNDGLLDVYEARLRLGDLAKVRGRLHHGAHLPHPRIRERRVPEAQLELGRPLPVELDGERVARASSISVRLVPDALRVVV
jgi:hypothetical protein